MQRLQLDLSQKQHLTSVFANLLYGSMQTEHVGLSFTTGVTVGVASVVTIVFTGTTAFFL
jgi:hypothetical protein